MAFVVTPPGEPFQPGWFVMLDRITGKLNAIRAWLISSISARLWLRRCDVVGKNTRTFWRPHIENRGRIEIGSRVRINSHWAPVELTTGPGGVLEIAGGVYINYGTLISARRRVRIGADVMVGNYCIIADTDAPGFHDPGLAPVDHADDVEIGDGAWIAARVTVLPGSRIGARTVIAAGSVVSGEIPPDVVAGGIPARVLRSSAATAASTIRAVSNAR